MSALLGFVVTQFVPREYTYYACTAIMFLFGLKMLWEAWRMSPDEGAETQREVEEELARYTVGLQEEMSWLIEKVLARYREKELVR